MSIREKVEDLGVEVAFAEAGVTPPSNDNTAGPRAGKPMDGSRRRARARAVMFGAGSLALYGALFLFSKNIMDVFTRGHFYTVLPVATVFLFSYVHGSFASNVWTALGIDASTKTARKAARPSAPRRDVRPRATAQL